MSRKAATILAAVLAALFLAAYFASPVFAFKALAEAGQTGNRGALAEYVDFPAVRADLKVQLQERMLGAFAKDTTLSTSPFGALGALLAPSIVGQVVDTAVTPEGIGAIIKSGKAPLTDKGEAASLAAPPAETAPPAPAGKPNKTTRFGYVDVNHFRARTAVGAAPPLGWVLERRGLFGWKLVRIELPPA